MAVGANLSNFNYRLGCRAGTDWIEQPFTWTILDGDTGIESNDNFDTDTDAEMWFRPAGQPTATPIVFKRSTGQLTYTSPNQYSITASAASNFQSGQEGNYDFVLYRVKADGTKPDILSGIVEVEPFVGAQA